MTPEKQTSVHENAELRKFVIIVWRLLKSAVALLEKEYKLAKDDRADKPPHP